MIRRRGPLTADHGTSLTELIVSIVVFGMVLTIVTTVLVATIGTSRATNTRVSNLSDAQTALDAMSKVIQTAAQPPAVAGATPAAAIIKATATDLQFYGYVTPGAAPAKVEFSLAGGTLTESITPSTNSGANACLPPYSYGASQTRVLARGITSSAIFSYYGQPTAAALNGVALPMSGSPASLAASDLQNVELVSISLNVSQQSNPVVYGTGSTITVSLPNHLVATPSIPSSAC